MRFCDSSDISIYLQGSFSVSNDIIKNDFNRAFSNKNIKNTKKVIKRHNVDNIIYDYLEYLLSVEDGERVLNVLKVLTKVDNQILLEIFMTFYFSDYKTKIDRELNRLEHNFTEKIWDYKHIKILWFECLICKTIELGREDLVFELLKKVKDNNNQDIYDSVFNKVLSVAKDINGCMYEKLILDS